MNTIRQSHFSVSFINLVDINPILYINHNIYSLTYSILLSNVQCPYYYVLTNPLNVSHKENMLTSLTKY